jgi:hypothetical protein
MEDATVQDALRLEDGNWRNWRATAEKTRDEKLKALAADCASKGIYQSGGRLKGDLKIIFDAIDGVVVQAVTLRARLASQNPALAEVGRLTPLRMKLEDFINSGVEKMEHQVSKTCPGLTEGSQRAILGLACQEAMALRTRVTNELENIPLELKLSPQKEERVPITIHVSGNANIINLGAVLGDVKASVQALERNNARDIGEAVSKLAEAIQASAELSDATRRDYLEHLATVSEQVAKPPEQRRIATFTNAISNLASIVSAGAKLAPIYEQLMGLLKDHHIIGN